VFKRSKLTIKHTDNKAIYITKLSTNEIRNNYLNLKTEVNRT